MMALVLTLFAMWMSLGPLPQVKGQTLPALGLYGWFYEHVPGFDGLRVPARYAMVGAVFLSIVAAYGAAAILQRVGRPALISTTIAVLFLIEAAFVPMPLNHTWGDGLVMPPARVEPAAKAPAVYQHWPRCPTSRVITEFPFGDPAWELRYVYYSTVHWKRLVNGYSGAFPRGYHVRVGTPATPGRQPRRGVAGASRHGDHACNRPPRRISTRRRAGDRTWLSQRGALSKVASTIRHSGRSASHDERSICPALYSCRCVSIL